MAGFLFFRAEYNSMSQNKSIKQRVAVFIDGSNLYHKLKDLNLKNSTYFQYGKLAQFLVRNDILVTKRYYIGVVRAKGGDEKAKQLQRNQMKLFNHLGSKQEGFVVERGYLMKSDGVFHEKGVDVKIAVDLLVGAYEDTYDRVVLISSDTDLIPVIEKVKSLGKKVEYIGFSHKPSYGLIKSASETRLLTKEEIFAFQTPWIQT